MTRVIRMKHFADGHTEEIIEEVPGPRVTDPAAVGPDYSTQAETAEGMIRNALQIAEAWGAGDVVGPLPSIIRLLRAALTKLAGREAAHPQGDQ